MSGDLTMSELCVDFGVSRKTGYKWLERYEAGGLEGLDDLSRRPHHMPQALDQAVADALVALRRARPTWGPKKLKAYLERHHSEIVWPAASTIGDLLQREGLVSGRKRRHRAPPYTAPFLDCCAPNEVWCLDFKGHFRTADGSRCDPFTLTDGFSRYVLLCQHVARTDEAHVKPLMERCFREHGLPRAIRSDNGAPFASSAPFGLSRLSIWWLKLGIVVERIDPGKPQQNGRHERFHLTLKKETAAPPATTLQGQQRRFNRFCQDFNTERPHEALGMKVPNDSYRPSPRPYVKNIPEPDYPCSMVVRRLTAKGEINWQGKRIFVSQTLRGEPIGLRETEHGWTVHFMHLIIGEIDHHKLKFKVMSGDPGDKAQPCQQGSTAQQQKRKYE
jgi:transposase InsO family protein